MPFAVVNFLQDNSVEAVPCAWLSQQDGKVRINPGEVSLEY
jgi:hypothetical protein